MVHLLLDDQMGAHGAYDSDMVFGGFAADLIFADAGPDYVVGYSGGDLLFGGDGDDLIEALEGRDRLHGDPGNDQLTGGRGKDKFYFEDTPGPLNVDAVRDFTHGRDKLVLDPDIFRRVNDHGALDEDFFRARADAQDRDDHILYDRHTGTLSYDKDASGGRFAPETFATLDGLPRVTADDFLVA